MLKLGKSEFFIYLQETFDITGRKTGAILKEQMLCSGKHAFGMPKGISANGMAVIAGTINGSMVMKTLFFNRR